jgi:oligopeptide transport system substrate-binding protein
MKMTSLASRAIVALSLAAGLPLQAMGATSPADPQKVLRTMFPSAESGFDPGFAQDLYSGQIFQAVFETLYTYDYLARPAKLAPEAAASLPEVTDGGQTYTIRLKKGIYFIPDPVFNGKKRELTMADYVYSFKRLLDPKIHSPHGWIFAGKVKGMDALIEKAVKTGKFDYDAPVEGFELLDRYTLRIHLTHPDFNLGMLLAHEPTGAVAREVIEKYRDPQGHVMDHPVGTGPYMLKQWVPGSKIVLEANPDYRGFTWDFQPGTDPEDQAIVAKMKGKRMPQIGRIEISVIIEDQARWLAFQNGELDLMELQGPLAPKALDGATLKPELAKKGVQLSRIIDPEISMYYWNMRDPVTGGLTKDKIALRRAIAMAHDIKNEIHILWNDQAVPLEYPIPPGVVGHDPDYKSSIQFDPAAANKLLDNFGYKIGADGWRTLPDGKPFKITFTARNESNGQLQLELWKRTYDSIHIRMDGDRKPFPDILKAEKQCKLQSRNGPWLADYPDGDNFMQLFYGPNSMQTNYSCLVIPEYDRMYEETQKMPAGPERDLLYHKMTRLLEVYSTHRLAYARYRNMLAQPRVIGHKKHPIYHQEWAYIDIDKSK